MTKKTIAIFVALATVVAGFLVLDSIYGLTGGFGRVVDGSFQLVDPPTHRFPNAPPIRSTNLLPLTA